MSTDASKRTWNLRAVLVAVVVFALSGCQATKTTPAAEASASMYREALRTSVIRDQPWKPMRETRAETEDPLVWRNRMYRYEYRPGEDDAGTLLEAARKGDALAMGKLDFYVLQLDPNWPHRFELSKMLALRRGVSGIAMFYSETRQTRRLRSDRRGIEIALQQIEGEAERGSLTDAVALYQFCGSLTWTKYELPECSNLSASVKALELIAAHHGSKALNNVAAFEAVRLGQGRERQRSLSGSYYPHTPQGWSPSHTLKRPTGTSNLAHSKR